MLSTNYNNNQRLRILRDDCINEWMHTEIFAQIRMVGYKSQTLPPQWPRTIIRSEQDPTGTTSMDSVAVTSFGADPSTTCPTCGTLRGHFVCVFLLTHSVTEHVLVWWRARLYHQQTWVLLQEIFSTLNTTSTPAKNLLLHFLVTPACPILTKSHANDPLERSSYLCRLVFWSPTLLFFLLRSDRFVSVCSSSWN